MNDGERYVNMDPKEDAKDMLERAIKNWWKLGGELSASMEKIW